ncbi:Uncharacterised protein [Mycobacteroides abscessus subsp. abscessus]|nr:Uncharacterised protein [Mycobacteroides abscessus subsp. abscessus]
MWGRFSHRILLGGAAPEESGPSGGSGGRLGDAAGRSQRLELEFHVTINVTNR